jgi:hypothetical protein
MSDGAQTATIETRIPARRIGRELVGPRARPDDPAGT